MGARGFSRLAVDIFLFIFGKLSTLLTVSIFHNLKSRPQADIDGKFEIGCVFKKFLFVWAHVYILTYLQNSFLIDTVFYI